MVARPWWSRAWLASRSRTSSPAFAQAIAMPPPIVPAPTMATRATPPCPSAPMPPRPPPLIPAARSAKNTWMSALAASDCDALAKQRRLAIRALVKRQRRRRLDGLDRLERRHLVRPDLLRQAPRGRKQRRVVLRRAQSLRELRGAPRRHATGDQVFGKRERARAAGRPRPRRRCRAPWRPRLRSACRRRSSSAPAPRPPGAAVAACLPRRG